MGLSMLDLAILGLLEEGELHGYEIRRRLRDHLGLLANVSFGSLYPALARLERAGMVEAIDAPTTDRSSEVPPTAPPTGSLSGELAVLRARRRSTPRARRSKKVYRITESGRTQFAELLAGGNVAEDARSFGLRVAFARHLAPPARLSLLERRRAQLHQRLDETGGAVTDPSLDVYARSVIEHTSESLQRDISWLDRLIQAERAGDIAMAMVAGASNYTQNTGRTDTGRTDREEHR